MKGRRRSRCPAADGPITLKRPPTRVAQISRRHHGADLRPRDFKMIDQSDMIISLIPQTCPAAAPPSPAASRRELHHAFEGGKEVYVIWRGKNPPSARS